MKPEDEALCGVDAGGDKKIHIPVAFYEFIKTALDSDPLGMDTADRLKVEHLVEAGKQRLSLVKQNGQST